MAYGVPGRLIGLAEKGGLGSKEEIGKKGGSLSNRLRAVLNV